MQFTITHPMHSHPSNPELITGPGIVAVAAAAEAAGFHGFGFTDHPAPTQRWLEAGGHDTLDLFVAMGFVGNDDAASDPNIVCSHTAIRLWWPSRAQRWTCSRTGGSPSLWASVT